MSDLNLNFFNNETYLEVNNTFVVNATIFDFVLDHVSSALNFYYTPLLIALGTIGNLVSVFVFYNSKLRVQSTSQYLSALAISDTIFLFQLLPPWLAAVQLNDLFHRPGFCQIFVYISYVTSCLSAWLVVAFTVERFVAVLYPLQRNAICTIKRARLIICGITLTAMVLNLPLLRFAVPKKNDCSIDQSYMEYAAKFNLMDTIISFSTPLSIIAVLNVWIMFGVCKLERTRQRLMRIEQQDLRARTSLNVHTVPRSQNKVTRMLLIVSSVFVIFNLPAYAMRIIAYAFNMGKTSDEYGNGHWLAMQQVALMFFYTNFGINFILYCLSGQNFRRALVQMLMSRTARRADAMRRPMGHPIRTNSISTSFVSNCTEATTAPVVAAPNDRRRRREHFITRWKFDNSRQLRNSQPQIEMRALPCYGNDG